jgi:hypothetical protein
MGKMDKTMEIHAPELCDLVGTLLASDPDLEGHWVHLGEDEHEESLPEEEPDLGELGEDHEIWASFPDIQPEDLMDENNVLLDEGSDDDVPATSSSAGTGLTALQRKRRKAAIEKRLAVKCVVGPHVSCSIL